MPNTMIHEVFGVRRVVGAFVGLELEVEGKKLPRNILGWDTHEDGSLRGGREYVSSAPAGSLETKAMLETVQKAFEAEGTELDYSFRTSTHCHVNMSNLSLDQTKATVVLYYLFEDLFAKFCAPHRRNNRFALTLKDAESIVDTLRQFVQRNELPNPDSGKYSALNICPLQSQGTIEFRMLEGTNNWEKIHLWVRVLLRLRKAGKELGSVDAVAAAKPEALLDAVFGTPKLTEAFVKQGWKENFDYQKSLMCEVFNR